MVELLKRDDVVDVEKLFGTAEVENLLDDADDVLDAILLADNEKSDFDADDVILGDVFASDGDPHRGQYTLRNLYCASPDDEQGLGEPNATRRKIYHLEDKNCIIQSVLGRVSFENILN